MEECVKIMHVGAVACRVARVSELFQIKKKRFHSLSVKDTEIFESDRCRMGEENDNYYTKYTHTGSVYWEIIYTA